MPIESAYTARFASSWQAGEMHLTFLPRKNLTS